MKKNLAELWIEWSEKIKEQKLSNKPATAWCMEKEISYNTFQYWKKRLCNKSPEKAIKNTFIEIADETPLAETSLRGVKISISRDFDRNALLHFLSLLQVK